jgi:hypothetical protein
LKTLFACQGGRILLPDASMVLISRESGGNLVVVPPRDVWERSELTATELTAWSFLVAAAGRAMLDVLPQLEGGCINYWEAGNWALNEQAEPQGPKRAEQHRSVHLHLLGRSRTSTNRSARWGEAPRFPDYADRLTWAADSQRLTAEECRDIMTRTDVLLRTQYAAGDTDIQPWATCGTCAYPTASESMRSEDVCAECEPNRKGEPA